ncbi:MAG: hypothetical protein ABI140_19885, partial [Jatrophihabitantaceae bacterium]
GHTRQAADIIASYLDGVRRVAGEGVLQGEWRRIWRGYASFAYFVEHALLKELRDLPAASDCAGSAGAAESEVAELLI